MVQVNTGPAAKLPECDPDAKLDASVRLLFMYDMRNDQMTLRVDLLLNAQGRLEPGRPLARGGGDQYNVALMSSPPVTPATKESDMAPGDLHVPSTGVAEGLSFRANRVDPAAALRGLADKLDPWL